MFQMAESPENRKLFERKPPDVAINITNDNSEEIGARKIEFDSFGRCGELNTIILDLCGI